MSSKKIEKTAFFYPKQSSQTSSKSPIEQANDAISSAEKKNNDLINLTEGRINPVEQTKETFQTVKKNINIYYTFQPMQSYQSIITSNSSINGYGRTLNVPKVLPPGHIPGPSYNGAVTIGEPCVGSHCSIPVSPNIVGMYERLISANPPPGALSQISYQYRPGNNSDILPGFTNYTGTQLNHGPFNFYVPQ
jgi:hypothetical protein